MHDARRIDWSTLFLIAGGIGLGALLSHAGLVALLTTHRAFQTLPPGLMRFGLCLVSAALSAVMSNTGTAASLVPLAAALDPSPSTAVLVAVSASMGAPFVVSTPPNAMAVANGLRSADLLVPGLLLLGGGCALIATTGPWVLHAMGIP
jgi:sodium-dependent dicarboxylate transporter 2/3/5